MNFRIYNNIWNNYKIITWFLIKIKDFEESDDIIQLINKNTKNIPYDTFLDTILLSFNTTHYYLINKQEGMILDNFLETVGDNIVYKTYDPT